MTDFKVEVKSSHRLFTFVALFRGRIQSATFEGTAWHGCWRRQDDQFLQYHVENIAFLALEVMMVNDHMNFNKCALEFGFILEGWNESMILIICRQRSYFVG